MTKRERRNNDLPNDRHKTKDRVTPTPLSVDDVNELHNVSRFNILMFQVP